MRQSGGIQAKLLRSFAFQSAVVLVLAFASVMVLDWRRATRDLQAMEAGIRAGLEAKGSQITGNISLVLRSLVEENAISSIRGIVDNMAAQDPGMAYAAYLDEGRQPWAFRTKLAYGSDANIRKAMDDSMSLWASQASSLRNRAWQAAEGGIIEFVAPVVASSGSRGVLRVGLDTRSMHQALASASRQAWRDRRLTMGVFFAAALCAFLLSLALSRLQSGRLTRPVLDLAASAQRIAGGDYNMEIEASGDGEIALLAETFESMRRKIHAYTNKLESLVAEKVRQIGDLLENVDQGLFTFNLDMTVNPDYSARACTVLRQDDLKGKSLQDILRMSPGKAGLFRDWIEVVRQEHGFTRWTKLVKLAPVHEIIFTSESGGEHTIEIDYRKILDPEGRLVKIMVLAQDVTEKRALERRLSEEKIRHECKVRIVLGVAGQAEEVIVEFLKDSTRRLESMRRVLDAGETEWKRHLFFDCHTLKGNAGGFGFDALAKEAQELESLLQNFEGREPGESFRKAAWDRLRLMGEEMTKIVEVQRLLSGGQGKLLIRLEPGKVERVMELAEKTSRKVSSADVQELAAACRILRHRTFGSLTPKYREIVARAAQKVGKEADLRILTPEVELDPALILRVDEALVHILRNALAHGIEDPETRARRGKGKGKVELSYARTPRGHVFVVQDDGKGIDREALAKRAVEMGMMTSADAALLDAEQKLGLLFKEDISTSGEADTLSGRGQGMAIALETIRKQGGQLTVESRPGAGARFTIILPDMHPESASPEPWNAVSKV